MTVMKNSIAIKVLLLTGALVPICFALSYVIFGVLEVPFDQVAVVYDTLTGKLLEPFPAGTYILGPFRRVANRYPLEILEYTMINFEDGAYPPGDAIEARTADGQPVWVGITVFVMVDPNNVNTLYTRWGAFYLDRFVRPISRAIVRDAIAQYTAHEIVSQRRVELRNVIRAELSGRFAEEGLMLYDALIRDMDFTPEYASLLEAQLIATQRTMLTQAAATPAP